MRRRTFPLEVLGKLPERRIQTSAATRPCSCISGGAHGFIDRVCACVGSSCEVDLGYNHDVSIRQGEVPHMSIRKL